MALRQASAEPGGSRGATAGTGRAGCDARCDVPRSLLSTLRAGLFSLAQTGLETTLLAGLPHGGMECRQRLWMAIAGRSSGEAWKKNPLCRGLARDRTSQLVMAMLLKAMTAGGRRRRDPASVAWCGSGRGCAPPFDTPGGLFPSSLMSTGKETGEGSPDSLPVMLVPPRKRSCPQVRPSMDVSHGRYRGRRRV